MFVSRKEIDKTPSLMGSMFGISSSTLGVVANEPPLRLMRSFVKSELHIVKDDGIPSISTPNNGECDSPKRVTPKRSPNFILIWTNRYLKIGTRMQEMIC